MTTIIPLHERPNFTAAFWALSDLWPAFMQHDPIADLYYSQLGRWRDHVFVAVDQETVVGRALAVPFRLGADVGRPALPANGWDGVVRWAWLDQVAGREPNHVSALEVTVAPAVRGTGLAPRLVAALHDAARACGAGAFVAPVRPSRKDREPTVNMRDYAARRRPDGLPADPWLRLHARHGGRIDRVCPTSMTIPGTIAQWRDWTGQPFDRDGLAEVPGALNPVHVDLAPDHAVYVEPNVWVVHRP